MSRRNPLPAQAGALLVALTVLTFPPAAHAAISPTDDPEAIAHAIMAAPAQLTGATWHQRPLNLQSSATATTLGTQPAGSAFPSEGDSFAILSSGHAWSADDENVSPEVSASGWGADRGDSHDVSALRLDINVPSTANCLSLDFSFLSEEWEGDYNDAFIAELDTSDWTASGTDISAPHNFAFDEHGDVAGMNAAGVAAVSAANAAGTTYNAASARISASTPITPGSHRIYLSISDNNDNALDSAAFVDNLQLGNVANPSQHCRAGARSAPPPFAPAQGGPRSATGREGSMLTTSGVFSASGPLPLLLAISPNPGRFAAHDDGSWTWSLRALDDLELRGITVSATSGFGFAEFESFDAIATNVAPTVTLSSGNDTVVDEGPAEHVVRYAISDPGADTISSVQTSCGPGSKVAGSDEHTNAEGSVRCVFADGPQSALVTVQATDDDGGVSELATQLVSVRNVAPAVQLSGAPPTFDEGPAQRTFEYAIDDPGRDTIVAVTSDCGDGGRTVSGSSRHTAGGGTFACVFADGPAAPAVTVAAEDSDGDRGARDSQAVAVRDVAPTLVLDASDPSSVDEGPGEVAFSYRTEDPGDDVVTVSASCGEQGEQVAGSQQAGRFACVFPDGDASSVIAASAVDSDGLAGEADTREIAIHNVAPTVSLDAANPGSVRESREARMYRYELSDPGDDTIESVMTSCGAAGAKVPGSDGHDRTSGRVSCVFEHGPATSELRVSATDSDGRTGAAAVQAVAVSDAPIAGDGAAIAGVETASISAAVAHFTDPTAYATADEYRATIDWGDAGATTAGTISKLEDGRFAVHGTHAYARHGDYDVSVHIADVDNPVNSVDTRATASIRDAPIHAAGTAITTPLAASGRVATFTDDADPDGRAADFSATIDWGDGSASSAGTISAPDASGRFGVSGSHTYAATGRYTVRVVVTSDGGSADSATSSALVYAWATATGGSFAIADGAGSAVTFWSGQWQDANPFVSGSPSVGAFKGYVDPPASMAARHCGDSWSARGGGGSAPPSSVPQYMAVLVASAMSKSGSTVGGDVAKVAVVHTGEGYVNDLAHVGTGTVVGTVCG